MVGICSRAFTLRSLQGFIVLVLFASLLPAQAEERQAPKANYQQANRFSKKNLDPLVYSTSVTPGWIGKTDSFWYSYKTSSGTNFYLIDPVKKAKKDLFNREKVASQLAELSRKPVEATSLPLTRASISSDGQKFSFVFGDTLYQYDLKAEKLTSQGKAPAGPAFPGGGRGTGRRNADAEFEEESAEETDEPQQKDTKDKTKGKGTDTPKGGQFSPTRAVAPDRKSVVFVKDNNLFLGEVGKDKDAVKLTTDGKEDYTFSLGGGAGRFGGGGPRGGLVQPAQAWSKDSKTFFAVRRDTRDMKELYLVDSIANPRPRLEKYKYAMPGEDNIRKTELHIGLRESKVLQRVRPKWRDEAYAELHWGKEPSELRFVRLDRLIRNAELCALDTATGNCRVLISEGFDNAPVFTQPLRYLEESDEMVWWSERTGWGHFYLYDRNGKLKNAITSGSWRASRILALDEKNRTLYFTGNAREKGENIYYEHLYSVKLDGTGLTLLNPGNADHPLSAVTPLVGGVPFGQTALLSPSRQYLVDNSSRLDEVPFTVLRDSHGNKVMDLEKADVSRLKEYGWKLPETFTVKAADGVTDLYGNMWKPFDFDSKKKYPIITYVYPGPQQEGITHTFSAHSSYQQLAQLGFIVIQVGHRGGAPTRSKAYASFGYFNLRDYALVDKKHAIEQLAARYPWIDIKKVGIYGHSGGGFMSAAALLQKPYNEFFTAAVASAGNHDNNIYEHSWAERYHGMKETILKEEVKDKTKGATPSPTSSPMTSPTPAAPPITAKTTTPPTTAPVAPPRSKFEIKVPTNAELAANLKGRLLLVHGEIDNNVHPANTMRLVDALIKANKRFDLLIIPGARHGFGEASGYFNKRMWEFFAEHLLGDRRLGADLDE